jgi:hypothetical protein
MTHCSITLFFLYIWRELGYNAMRSTDDPYAMDRFFIFKIQMINITTQNDFHMKI